MTARTIFSILLLFFMVIASIMFAGLQMPLVDPLLWQPALTLTPWSVPALPTVTIVPTWPDLQSTWYNDLPTPIPMDRKPGGFRTAAPASQDFLVK